MENYTRKDLAGMILFALGILSLCLMILSPLTHLIVHIDEYFTLTLLNMPVGDIITITAGDVHPPLYYLMAKAFVNITEAFGLDLLFSLKILSVIPYILILIISATKIRKDYSWLAAGLFAFSVGIMTEFFSHYLRARMYSWAILFVVLAFIAFMDLIETKDRKHWILLTVFSVLCAYTQYFAAITAGSIYLVLLIYLIKFERQHLKAWALSVATAIVLYVPWAFILLNQLETIHHTYWIPGLTMPTIVNSLGYFAYNDNVLFSVAAIIILLIIVFIYWKYAEITDGKSRFRDLSAIMIYLGTIILAMAITEVFRPILVIRYLIPVSAILWLGISILLTKIKDKRMFIVSFALIVILLISGVAATISSNDEIYNNGVIQKEVLDNITQDSNSTLIVNNPHLVMYFLHLANKTDMYCLNMAQLFGENMTRLHQIYDFKSFKANDIDGVIENSSGRDVYIISWNDPIVNSPTVKLDNEGNIVFSKVNQTGSTLV